MKKGEITFLNNTRVIAFVRNLSFPGDFPKNCFWVCSKIIVQERFEQLIEDEARRRHPAALGTASGRKRRSVTASIRAQVSIT